MMFLKRVAGLSHSEFLTGYLDTHVPMLLGRMKAAGTLNRAVFDAALDRDLASWPRDYDGVLELWFDDARSAAAALTLLNGDRSIREDSARWLNLEATLGWIGEARVVLDKPGAKVKLIVAGSIADGWTEEEAQRYWRDVHPVVARGQDAFWNLLRRYTQIHGRTVPGVAGHMPIAAEIGAASFEDLDAAFAHEQYVTTVRPDELKFAKPQEMTSLASDREVILYDRTQIPESDLRL